MRPTRQSLTNRLAIPERTMVARNETEPWSEEREREPTLRIHVFCDRDSFLFRIPVLRHGMPCLWLKDCRVAALLAMTRNWDVFIWKTDVFCGCFCAVSLHIVFQTFRSGNCSVSSQSLSVLSLRGERILCARRGNLKRIDLPSRNELWLCGTKQNLGRKREEAKRRSESIFCDRASLLLCTPVLRHGMPCLKL